jgi:nucleoside-diphosphate-sugar epimerase
MHALVTGASGFLGGRLVDLLLAEGATVAVLARPDSILPDRPGVHVLRIDLLPDSSEPEDLELFRPLVDTLATITHVFHCAGCSTDWAPIQQYRDANITTVSVLLELLKNFAPGLQRFLHVSTTDVYGYPASTRGEEMTATGDESMPRRDVALPYNASKLRGEELVWAAGSAGVPITVVRPASIYGPGGKAFVTDIVALLKQRLMLLVDNGRAPGGFVYVDDVCRAMLTAATAPHALGEAYNLSSTDGTTWRTYTQALAKALSLPAPWLSLPFRAAMALAAASELPHKCGLPGRAMLTRHAVYLLGRTQQYSTAKAQEQLGWTPQIALDEGIARSVTRLP